MDGFLDINQLLENEYGFDGKDLFRKPYIQLESIGDRKKFWIKYKDNKFLYKKSSKNLHEVYGEIISQEIARILDIPCAHYQMAKFNYSDESLNLKEFENSVGCLSISFLKPTERFIPMGEIISTVVRNYISVDPKLALEYGISGFDDKASVGKLSNLEDVSNILEYYFKNRFDRQELLSDIITMYVKMYLFDIITLQGDRHIWNYGIIKDNDGKIKPSPLFDNANICNLNRSKTVNEYVNLVNSNKLRDITKKPKMEKDIHNAAYHSVLRFGVSENDFKCLPNLDKRVEQLKSLEYFISYSETSYVNLLQSYIDNLLATGIETIVENCCLNTGHDMDKNFKKYIISILNYNLNNIKSLLDNYNMKRR